jgi:hypothetical protein
MMPLRLSRKGRLQVLYIVLEQTKLHPGTPLDRLLNTSSSSLLTCSSSLSWGLWSVPCKRSQGSTSHKQLLHVVKVAG